MCQTNEVMAVERCKVVSAVVSGSPLSGQGPEENPKPSRVCFVDSGIPRCRSSPVSLISGFQDVESVSFPNTPMKEHAKLQRPMGSHTREGIGRGRVFESRRVIGHMKILEPPILQLTRQ